MKRLGALLSLLARSPQCTCPQNRNPQILADDVGYDDAGCFDGEMVQTLSMDRLAAGGVR